MRRGGGHSKGSSFEREIAKKIVKAFKPFGIEQRECWRSVMSGGHEISAGDLYFSERLQKLFPFSVECKFRKKVNWDNFSSAKKSEEGSWLVQAKDGASKRKGTVALLVVKANHAKIKVLRCCGHHTEGMVKPAIVDVAGYVWQQKTWTGFLAGAVHQAKE